MKSQPLAVITGAASGIGRALALRAAVNEEHQVALLDVDVDGLARVHAEVLAGGGSASSFAVDLTDSEAVAACARQVLEELGVPSLLVCNAGVEYSGRLWDMTPQAWRRVQAINVDGAFYTAQAFLPSMIAADAPSKVLFTSSVGGIGIGASQGAYTVSKHAVRVLAQSFAADLEDINAPIDVSILLPAAVRTQIFERAELSDTDDAREFHARMLAHLEEEGKTPAEIAEVVFEGLNAGKRWIYPHPERGEFFVKQHVAELLAGVENP